MNFRSSLHRAARILGDIQAARRGPRATIMRVARNALLREYGKQVNRLIR